MYSNAKIISARYKDKNPENISSPRPSLKANNRRLQVLKEEKRDLGSSTILEIKNELDFSISEIRNMIQRISSNNDYMKTEIDKVDLNRL